MLSLLTSEVEEKKLMIEDRSKDLEELGDLVWDKSSCLEEVALC
jgi:hypothetical protein